MTPGATIAVVIPTFRGAAMTMACLDSLRHAVDRVDGTVEVVVVDDGSADDSVARIQAAHSWVTVEARSVNGGYSAAINSGLRATTAPWVLTLNNDTTADQDLLVELLAVANGCPPDVGALAAQQRFSDRPGIICSAGVTLDRIGVTADRLLGQPVTASETQPVEVFGACGAAAVYRRRLVDEIGLFDEAFRFGLEDTDYAWRARMHGWRCLYVPRAVVMHDVGGTVAYGSELRFRQAGRNRVRLIIKNADRRMLLRYGVLMIVWDLAYLLVAALRYRTLAPVRGRWESLRSWRSIRGSGDLDRRPVELAPFMGFRAAMARQSILIRS